jgi:hypothetical protein
VVARPRGPCGTVTVRMVDLAGKVVLTLGTLPLRTPVLEGLPPESLGGGRAGDKVKLPVL